MTGHLLLPSQKLPHISSLLSLSKNLILLLLRVVFLIFFVCVTALVKGNWSSFLFSYSSSLLNQNSLLFFQVRPCNITSSLKLLLSLVTIRINSTFLVCHRRYLLTSLVSPLSLITSNYCYFFIMLTPFVSLISQMLFSFLGILPSSTSCAQFLLFILSFST